MGVITISREAGCYGRTIGLKVAEDLAYHYLDKELVVEVARLAEVPVAAAERLDENPEPEIVRLFNKIFPPPGRTLPSGPLGDAEWPYAVLFSSGASPLGDTARLDEDTFVRLTQEAMMYWTRAHDLVCIGRGGQALLARGFEALHVRLTAPWDYRLKAVIEQSGDDNKGATEYLETTDARRRLYLSRHYGIDWADPANYHLVLNVSQLGVENTVRVIVQAAREIFKRPAGTHSAQAIQNDTLPRNSDKGERP